MSVKVQTDYREEYIKRARGRVGGGKLRNDGWEESSGRDVTESKTRERARQARKRLKREKKKMKLRASGTSAKETRTAFNQQNSSPSTRPVSHAPPPSTLNSPSQRDPHATVTQRRRPPSPPIAPLCPKSRRDHWTGVVRIDGESCRRRCCSISFVACVGLRLSGSMRAGC